MRARLIRLAWALSGAFAALALLSIIALASCTRFTGDDFGTIGAVRLLGFWRAQSFWWQTWTGRFAATATTSFFQLLGPRLAWIATAVSIALWVGAVALLLRRFVAGCLTRAALALLFVSATLLGMPALQELVFWQTGVVTYTFPLGAAILVLAWAAPGEQRAAPGWSKALLLLAGIYLAGFSETSAASLLAAAALLLLWSVVTRRPYRDVVWLLGGLILGFLLMAAAPGNAVRLARLPAEPAAAARVGPLNTIFLTAAYLVYRLLRFYPALAAVVLLAPMLGGLGAPAGAPCEFPRGFSASRFLGLFLRAGAILLLMCAPVVPGAILVSRPPDRALLWTQAALVLGLAYFGWLVGRALSGRVSAILRPAAALLLCVAAALAFLPPAGGFWSLRSAGVTFARHWDQYDSQARRAVSNGQEDVIVPAVPTDFTSVYVAPGLIRPGLPGGDELSVSPQHWVNQTAAAYYGCRTIRVDSSHGDRTRELNDPLPIPFPSR